MITRSGQAYLRMKALKVARRVAPLRRLTYQGVRGGDHVFLLPGGNMVLVDLVLERAREVGGEDCLERRQPEDRYAGVNALRVETMRPRARCVRRLPRHWPQDMTATRWLLSGGDPVVFGPCTPGNCPPIREIG